MCELLFGFMLDCEVLAHGFLEAEKPNQLQQRFLFTPLLFLS